MTNKLTKAETIALIADKAGMPKTQVEKVLNAAEAVVTETLTAGNSLPLLGGTFKASERAAREGVNPQNPSEKIQIPASKGVNFKPGSALKGELNK